MKQDGDGDRLTLGVYIPPEKSGGSVEASIWATVRTLVRSIPPEKSGGSVEAKRP